MSAFLQPGCRDQLEKFPFSRQVRIATVGTLALCGVRFVSVFSYKYILFSIFNFLQLVHTLCCKSALQRKRTYIPYDAVRAAMMVSSEIIKKKF